MNNQNRNTLSATLSRVSPALIWIFALVNSILNPSYQSFYLLILLLILAPINWIIKNLIVKPFYSLLKVKSLPILGIGERPVGAKSCRLILDNIDDKSYGMPSGHSQMIWTIGTYLIFKTIDNWIIKTKTDHNMTIQLTVFDYMWIILICIVILLTMIFVSYSRVYIEGCHTIQQVIVGGILGSTSGFIIYYFENDAVKVLSKII